MAPETFASLVLFSVATLFTPGPNNIMLMASGANFGPRRSLPHLIGVAFGFPAMMIPVGLGVMRVFDLWPPAHTILLTVSAVFLLYLAWKIATAEPDTEQTSEKKPITLWQAAAFQWVNPKAWSIALGAVTIYAQRHDIASVLWIAGVFAAVGVLSAATWVTIGTSIARFLVEPGRLRLFNWGMALLLIASMIPVLFG